MASSGIGGQAVIEGVMMKNGDTYAVAVRKPDQTIVVEKKEYKSVCPIRALRNVPIVRGVVNFVDSLVLGLSTISYSASFYDDEEEGERTESSEKKDKAILGATMVFSVVIAVAIFMVLPYFLSQLFQKFIENQTVVILLEGIIRLSIFLLYIVLVAKMEDIRRVFMYHGAEHKCINCIEHGLELNVENVRKSSRQHKRCGTSFLFVVVMISIIVTMFIRADSRLVQLLLRLLMIPVIAGVSYEFIRLAGNSENPIVNLLSKPGMWLQRLTTREPDDTMIEVGIASVEAVFDWKEYIRKMGNP